MEMDAILCQPLAHLKKMQRGGFSIRSVANECTDFYLIIYNMITLFNLKRIEFLRRLKMIF